MTKGNLPEYWLRGPVGNMPDQWQPAAHALLQAHDEVFKMMAGFPDELLWVKPAGLASPGFHLQHIAGVIDRMITYKNDRPLSLRQLTYLQNEGHSIDNEGLNSLLTTFDNAIKHALMELEESKPQTFAEYRGVGRKQLPSTVGGLLFHMAEHTMRHTGQLLVTVTVLKNWV